MNHSFNRDNTTRTVAEAIAFDGSKLSQMHECILKPVKEIMNEDIAERNEKAACQVLTRQYYFFSDFNHACRQAGIWLNSRFFHSPRGFLRASVSADSNWDLRECDCRRSA